MKVGEDRHRVGIGCGVLLLLCAIATDAATADWRVLKGLKGCEVVVAGFGADALAAGYSQEAFRTKASRSSGGKLGLRSSAASWRCSPGNATSETQRMTRFCDGVARTIPSP